MTLDTRTSAKHIVSPEGTRLVTSQIRRLRNADFPDDQAEALADVISDATRDLVTRSEFYRALWLQGLAIIGVNAAMLSAAVAILD